MAGSKGSASLVDIPHLISVRLYSMQRYFTANVPHLDGAIVRGGEQVVRSCFVPARSKGLEALSPASELSELAKIQLYRSP